MQELTVQTKTGGRARILSRARAGHDLRTGLVPGAFVLSAAAVYADAGGVTLLLAVALSCAALAVSELTSR